MSTLELQQRIVEQTRDLPPQLLQEVADFVSFLKTKYAQPPYSLFSGASLVEEQHLEEEFADYKQQYPVE
ncbi:hypothetical protein [Spirosoma litoris]